MSEPHEKAIDNHAGLDARDSVAVKPPVSPVWLAALGVTLYLSGSAPGKEPPGDGASAPTPVPGFSIQVQDGSAWLVRPDGKRFFSLGVCCVDMGTAPHRFTQTNPSYAAWQHYATSNRWAETTLKRLKSWGFTTLGGWSDFLTLRQAPDMDMALAPVLHIGSTAGAPWWDMWDAKVTGRMDQVAREQIMGLRDDPHLLGYYSDNEMGWWNAALFRMTLQHTPTSGQRQQHYCDSGSTPSGLVDCASSSALCSSKCASGRGGRSRVFDESPT